MESSGVAASLLFAVWLSRHLGHRALESRGYLLIGLPLGLCAFSVFAWLAARLTLIVLIAGCVLDSDYLGRRAGPPRLAGLPGTSFQRSL